MLVFDETVTIFIAVIPNPFQGAVGVGQQGCDRLPGKAPAAYSSQDVDEKRGSVNASVVGVFAAQGESAGNTKPHLMQDLARLFLGQRIHYAALALSQSPESSQCQGRVHWQIHFRSPQRVPAE